LSPFTANSPVQVYSEMASKKTLCLISLSSFLS
jgi:hypothetical protein